VDFVKNRGVVYKISVGGGHITCAKGRSYPTYVSKEIFKNISTVD
jgi:hypothetical protein